MGQMYLRPYLYFTKLHGKLFLSHYSTEVIVLALKSVKIVSSWFYCFTKLSWSAFLILRIRIYSICILTINYLGLADDSALSLVRRYPFCTFCCDKFASATTFLYPFQHCSWLVSAPKDFNHPCIWPCVTFLFYLKEKPKVIYFSLPRSH